MDVITIKYSALVKLLQSEREALLMSDPDQKQYVVFVQVAGFSLQCVIQLGAEAASDFEKSWASRCIDIR